MPYPTPPGTRIPYDLDGTVAIAQATVSRDWIEIPQTSLKYLNAERSGGAFSLYNDALQWNGGSVVLTLVLIFPTPIRLQGVTPIGFSSTFPATQKNWRRFRVETSVNSTNGVDGDWVEVLPQSAWSATIPNAEALTANSLLTGSPASGLTVLGPSFGDSYRYSVSDRTMGYEAVSGPATLDVAAVRVSGTSPGGFSGTLADYGGMYIHLYGYPEPLSPIDHLDFWQSDLDLRIAADTMDWGDVPISSTADKSFRIKNSSSTKVARMITITGSPATSPSSPSVAGFLLFSLDGVTWRSQITLGSIAPGSVSSEVMIRRVVPFNAMLSNWTPRVTATVERWV